MGFVSKKMPNNILKNVNKWLFLKRSSHFLRICILRLKNKLNVYSITPMFLQSFCVCMCNKLYILCWFQICYKTKKIMLSEKSYVPKLLPGQSSVLPKSCWEEYLYKTLATNYIDVKQYLFVNKGFSWITLSGYRMSLSQPDVILSVVKST